MLWMLLAIGVGACGDAGRKRLGQTCDDSAQCESGLCLNGQCTDPTADDDVDGLTNGLESRLGSNAGLGDSDEDGIRDPDELGANFELADGDGDGKPDILESAVSDVDGDCITDQYDAEDGFANGDLSPMVAVVCSFQGICADERGALRVACPSDANGKRAAVCVYDGVPGYASPEVRCDGRDENCDGQVDEAFPGGCARPAQPFVAVGSGGTTLATSRYRATLVMGQPALQRAETSRHRALVGANPFVAPQATPETP